MSRKRSLSQLSSTTAERHFNQTQQTFVVNSEDELVPKPKRHKKNSFTNESNLSLHSESSSSSSESFSISDDSDHDMNNDETDENEDSNNIKIDENINNYSDENEKYSYENKNENNNSQNNNCDDENDENNDINIKNYENISNYSDENEKYSHENKNENNNSQNNNCDDENDENNDINIKNYENISNDKNENENDNDENENDDNNKNENESDENETDISNKFLDSLLDENEYDTTKTALLHFFLNCAIFSVESIMCGSFSRIDESTKDITIELLPIQEEINIAQPQRIEIKNSIPNTMKDKKTDDLAIESYKIITKTVKTYCSSSRNINQTKLKEKTRQLTGRVWSYTPNNSLKSPILTRNNFNKGLCNIDSNNKQDSKHVILLFIYFLEQENYDRLDDIFASICSVSGAKDVSSAFEAPNATNIYLYVFFFFPAIIFESICIKTIIRKEMYILYTLCVKISQNDIKLNIENITDHEVNVNSKKFISHVFKNILWFYTCTFIMFHRFACSFNSVKVLYVQLVNMT